MPTDILRARNRRSLRKNEGPRTVPDGTARQRRMSVRGHGFTLVAELHATVTADRLWAALPLNGACEAWGETLHFEVPVASGRERGARLGAAPGDICFWPSQRRLILVYGATPISRAGEVRMPEPVNIVARLIGDAGTLRRLGPGERVVLERLDP